MTIAFFVSLVLLFLWVGWLASILIGHIYRNRKGYIFRLMYWCSQHPGYRGWRRRVMMAWQGRRFRTHR